MKLSSAHLWMDQSGILKVVFSGKWWWEVRDEDDEVVRRLRVFGWLFELMDDCDDVMDDCVREFVDERDVEMDDADVDFFAFEWVRVGLWWT